MPVTKSVNVWSLPGGLDGSIDPRAAISLAKQCGFEGLELGIGPAGCAFGLDASRTLCEDLLAFAQDTGVRLDSVASGLYWGRNLADESADARHGAFQDLEAMLQIANWIGAKTLLTIPGAVDVFFLPDRKPLSTEHVWDNATNGVRSLVPMAEALGVRLGVENVWNKFLLSPHEMATFVDQFDSTMVGAYVDVANLLPFGYAQDWIRHLGKRIVGIHFKDFRRSVGTVDGFVDLLEGDVDWPEVMNALGEVGYEGPVVAEMIPLYRHFPLVRVQNASNAMDKILGRS